MYLDSPFSCMNTTEMFVGLKQQGMRWAAIMPMRTRATSLSSTAIARTAVAIIMSTAPYLSCMQSRRKRQRILMKTWYRRSPSGWSRRQEVGMRPWHCAGRHVLNVCTPQTPVCKSTQHNTLLSLSLSMSLPIDRAARERHEKQRTLSDATTLVPFTCYSADVGHFLQQTAEYYREKSFLENTVKSMAALTDSYQVRCLHCSPHIAVDSWMLVVV